MDIDQNRAMTEEEFFFAEEAFSEFKNLGATQKKCPWCEANLIFEDRLSAHTIKCSSCNFGITARGI